MAIFKATPTYFNPYGQNAYPYAFINNNLYLLQFHSNVINYNVITFAFFLYSDIQKKGKSSTWEAY